MSSHIETAITAMAAELGIPDLVIFDRLILNDNDQLELDLSQLNLKIIPPSIAKLDKLVVLDVSRNLIEDIPDQMCNLFLLENLNLSYNRIQIINHKLQDLLNLTILNLSDNKIVNIPRSLAALTSLEKLKLQNNNIKDFYEEFSSFIHIIDLNLSNNRFQSVPSCISNLISLEILDLSNNNISTLSMEFSRLDRLHILLIDNNPIQSINQSWTSLPAIETISISGNRLIKLPELIPYSLKNLNIQNNNIQLFPCSYLLLDNLKGLFSESKFAKMRKEFKTFLAQFKTECKLLSLEILDDKIFLALKINEQGYYSLDLSGCDLKYLPFSLFTLSTLKILDLSDNLIEEIPNEIMKLNRLTEINLSFNQIPRLDIDFSEFRSMKIVNLANNNLTHFPIINRTTFINSLDISNNTLETILVSPQNFAELRKLVINNNGTAQIPSDLLKISTLFDIVVDASQAEQINENPFLQREIQTKLQII